MISTPNALSTPSGKIKYPLVEPPDDGFELMEVWPLHTLLGPALLHHLNHLLLTHGVLVRTGAEGRVASVFHILHDF